MNELSITHVASAQSHQKKVSWQLNDGGALYNCMLLDTHASTQEFSNTIRIMLYSLLKTYGMCQVFSSRRLAQAKGFPVHLKTCFEWCGVSY